MNKKMYLKPEFIAAKFEDESVITASAGSVAAGAESALALWAEKNNAAVFNVLFENLKK